MSWIAPKGLLGTGVLVLGLALPATGGKTKWQGDTPESPPVEQMQPEVADIAAKATGAGWDPSAIAAALGASRWDPRVTRNARVEVWIAFLQGRNRDRTELWLERSGRYAPMIRQALRDREMPEDLLYLAFIESGFSPHAYSPPRPRGSGNSSRRQVDGTVSRCRDSRSMTSPTN